MPDRDLCGAVPNLRVRFGEIEARDIAVTPAGRKLYDDLIVGPKYRPHRANHFGGQRDQRRISGDAARMQPRIVLTYEGTSEMHLLIIGQALTGHAAFA
ncbi:hypothetical protein BOO86_21680 [Mycobacterium sp. CBMA 234]|nr:hypothetical protein [Mycolicibacterium sp. CBMA 234]